MNSVSQPSDAQLRYLAQSWPRQTPLTAYVAERNLQILRAYSANPLLVSEHANIERSTALGGYGRRQIYELIQNAADAMLETLAGRIEVIIKNNYLYCANTGIPMIKDGVDAIFSSHLSVKRGNEIGRFGLGFKSVLGVSDAPQVFSRSGCFGFNRTNTEKAIRTIVPDTERTPVLRIGETLDPLLEAAQDPDLARLMMWAVTVIRLPLLEGHAAELTGDLEDFPAEFMLFAQNVADVLLDSDKLERRITIYSREDSIELESSRREGSRLLRQNTPDAVKEVKEITKWKIFSSHYRPSDRARKDAGELSDRASVPLMWAAPLSGQARRERGKFWAFFPTEYVTTLSGILNAPWKTNEDRLNLLKGPFNEELMQEASRLIATSISKLQTEEDPAYYFDLLPGRGREAANWADDMISDKVYKELAKHPCIPDQHGTLQHPGILSYHPDFLDTELLKKWSGAQQRPDSWVHSSLSLSKDRRSRAERLEGSPPGSKREATLGNWLRALTDKDLETARIGLQLAVDVREKHADILSSHLQTAMFIPIQNQLHNFSTIDRIHLPTEGIDRIQNINYVRNDLAADELSVNLLTILGVRTVNQSTALLEFIDKLSAYGASYVDWTYFWRLIRNTDITGNEVAERITRASTQHPSAIVHARTVAGKFRAIQETLLPGPIIEAGDSDNEALLIDTIYHAADLEILKRFGATAEPHRQAQTSGESAPWRIHYENAARSAFLNTVPQAVRAPGMNYIGVVAYDTSGPLAPFMKMSHPARARYSTALLHFAVLDSDWEVCDLRKTSQLPPLRFESPSLWLIREHGYLNTSCGIQPTNRSVGPQLMKWRDYLSVADIPPSAAERLGLPTELQALSPANWQDAIERTLQVPNTTFLTEFYAAAARAGQAVPALIACRLGNRFDTAHPKDVTLIADRLQEASLVALEIPFLSASKSDADVLLRQWRLLPIESSVQQSVSASPSSAAIPLADRLPSLADAVENGDDLKIVPCTSILIEQRSAHGRTDQPRRAVRDGQTIYVLDSLTDEEMVQETAAVLDVTLSHVEQIRLVEQQQQNKARLLLNDITRKKSLADKLLTMVGVDALRRRVPVALANSAAATRRKQNPDVQTAELVLAVYGVETLREFRTELEQRGLRPPQQWAGSIAAHRFIKSLGFPPAYAGFPSAERRPTLEIDGSPQVPPLHDYQRAIVAGIQQVLIGTSNRRGLVSLPTGAGKTRVAAQALIEAWKSRQIKGIILWVAQSDELCEQAVQSWRDLWRAMGPQRRLMINRLWGDNEAVEADDAFQLVVGTIQKLKNCADDDNYSWLQAACVVIDEAHQATTPEYTRLLEWQGLGRGRDRCPLLGLTATPYRGSEQQTEVLANRFGKRRIDQDALGDDPYARLQELGVLARVDHQILAGAEVELTAKELDDLRRTNFIPRTVEERVGAMSERNKTILDAVLKLPKDWPSLIFAASVDHAQSLAAMLQLEGRSAAAISSHTEPAVRRFYIEEFRSGRLQVLTNYGVLTTGFDAPATRAVFVTRPTYSKSLYQQMIGRGLRGPLNGGKERCMIVNVRDNIQQYGEELAFNHFDYLWRSV